jgi:putative ABC transport system substrate-binding protein
VLPPSRARAQRAAPPARVGWLSYLAESDPVLLRLREGLRELGYVEGKSLVIVPRFAHGDFTRLPQL